VGLELDMEVSGGVIDEDTPTRVHGVFMSLPTGREETTAIRTVKVIDRDTLTREEVIFFEHTSTITNRGSHSTRCRASRLFSILTGGTLGGVNKLACGCMQTA
jgi:hypothetical protein